MSATSLNIVRGQPSVQMQRSGVLLNRQIQIGLEPADPGLLHLLVLNYTKNDVRARIQEVTARPVQELLPDEVCEDGTPLRALPADWIGADGQPKEDALTRRFPKFLSPENIVIVVAGGTAGKFSAVVGGWAAGGEGSTAVTKEIIQ